MLSTDREMIIAKTNILVLRQRICAGVSKIKTKPVISLVLLLYFLFAVLAWNFCGTVFSTGADGFLMSVLGCLIRLALLLFFTFGLIVILVLLGTPPGCRTIRDAFQQAGLVNHIGEAPVLIAKNKDKINPRVIIFDFFPCGISLDEWENKRSKVETALNVIIAKMAWGDGRKTIRIHAVPARNDFPTLLQWDERFLRPENFVLALGEGLAETVTVDLAKTPHILLGGSTGSGKSVLLKLLLMQSYCKGAEIFIVDLKGGVDFEEIWHYKCWICIDTTMLSERLDWFVLELERRKRLFKEAKCSNIDQYNADSGDHLKRFIFACDEVAEVLDKTGLNKEQKELVSQIESKLSTIARQGRAFGLHLFLATQRPDATVIPGQIRNNIDFRVCGRADNVLSQIILDSTIASDQIPKDAQGRFVTGDGVVFQAYWFDEKEI